METMESEVYDKHGNRIEIGDIIRSIPPYYVETYGKVVEIKPTRRRQLVYYMVKVQTFVVPQETPHQQNQYPFRNFESERVEIVAKVGLRKEEVQKIKKLARRVMCSLLDCNNKPMVQGIESDTSEQIGQCPVCLDPQYFYHDMGLCANQSHQHAICWTCINKIRQTARDNPTGFIIIECPVCRVETRNWENCALTQTEQSQLQSELFESNSVLGPKLIISKNINPYVLCFGGTWCRKVDT